jgi:micrococcal nuclease
MKLNIKPLFALFQALTITLICSSCINLAAAEIPSNTREAKIVQVIDGDTVIVELDRQRVHLRLIGIDTPESRPNKRSERQAADRHTDQKTILGLGRRSSDHTRKLLPKKSLVRLEFDVERRDHYGRLLAYIWIPSQGYGEAKMANEEILRAGYAYPLSVPPNLKYRDRFSRLFKEARQAKRGLWER